MYKFTQYCNIISSTVTYVQRYRNILDIFFYSSRVSFQSIPLKWHFMQACRPIQKTTWTSKFKISWIPGHKFEKKSHSLFYILEPRLEIAVQYHNIMFKKKYPSRAGLRSFCPKVIYHIFQFSQEKPQISHPLVAKKNTLITPSKILQAQKLWITLLLICGSLYKHCKTTKWGIQPESKAQH